jgi:hypothetical protein
VFDALCAGHRTFLRPDANHRMTLFGLFPRRSRPGLTMDPALRRADQRIVRARGRREDDIVFVIRLRDGEEIRGSANEALTVNENTGVLCVHRVDGFEEVTTHYSPSAWAWVTHRVKEPGVRR